MRKVLIVNPFGIGDVLFTTPLIAALKAREEVSISYLANARTAPILKNDPRIDKVYTYERDEFVALYKKSPLTFLNKWNFLINDLRREKFHAAYDFSMGGPLSMALVWAGIPERIGFNYKNRGLWLTRKVPLKGFEGRHVVEYYLDLLRHLTLDTRHSGMLEPTSVQCPVSSVHSMQIFPSASDTAWANDYLRRHQLKPGAFIVMYPGGGASWGKSSFQKRWPAEQYVQLADKLIEKQGLPIILMGDQSEKELCEKVLKGIVTTKLPGVNAAGETTVLQAAALMRQSRFVIANDGGPLHVAVASGASTVSLFGPVDPLVYGPFPKSAHKVVIKGLACQPCYRRFRMSDCRHISCLRTLTVEQVYKECETFGYPREVSKG